MAGDWIKMTTNLHEKPEVVALSGELGIDRFSIVGRLHRVWAWFDAHSSDGHAKGVTNVFIDELACHTGFADALRKVDWLIDRSGSLSVPHFDRHNGQSAKKRAESTERKRKSRNTSQCNSDIGHAKSVTKARPEKRREEKNKKTTSSTPIPSLQEVESYLLEQMPKINPEWTPERIKRATGLQYETMVEAGWKDGNGKPIKVWKTKIKNIMSYKKPWSYGEDDQPQAAQASTPPDIGGRTMSITKASEIAPGELNPEEDDDIPF